MSGERAEWVVCWCLDSEHDEAQWEAHPGHGAARLRTVMDAIATAQASPGAGHVIRVPEPEPIPLVTTVVVLAAIAVAVLATVLVVLGLALENTAALGLGLMGLAFVAVVSAGLAFDVRRARPRDADTGAR